MYTGTLIKDLMAAVERAEAESGAHGAPAGIRRRNGVAAAGGNVRPAAANRTGNGGDGINGGSSGGNSKRGTGGKAAEDLLDGRARRSTSPKQSTIRGW